MPAIGRHLARYLNRWRAFFSSVAGGKAISLLIVNGQRSTAPIEIAASLLKQS